MAVAEQTQEWRQKAEELLLLQGELDARKSIQDPYQWLTESTCTKDEQDSHTPYKPLPKLNYIRFMVRLLEKNPCIFIYKSRTMRMTWLVTGMAAHLGFTREATGVIFKAPDQDRAVHCVDCVKIYHERSIPALRAKWKLGKPIHQQPFDYFELANGSWFYGIVGDPNKIRFKHPTMVVMDESAFDLTWEASFNTAVATRCPYIVNLSSVEPGPYQDLFESSKPADFEDFGVPDEGIPGLSVFKTPEGHPFVLLNYRADESLKPQDIPVLRARYTSQAFWDKEMECNAAALSGMRVYPEFRRDLHVISHKRIPTRGCLYMSIDPHPRTPHAFLWILVDRWSDWYVYRELWPSTAYAMPRRMRDDEQDNVYTIREYVETLAHLEGNSLEWFNSETDDEYAMYREQKGGEKIVLRFMDQAGKAFMATGEGQRQESYSERYTRFGIQCRDPLKQHRAGEDAIHELLKPREVDDGFARIHGIQPDEHGRFWWPRLHISDRCPELVLEILKHRFKVRNPSEEREMSQQEVEYRTHELDNLRYIATSRQVCYDRNWESSIASAEWGGLEQTA